MSRFSDPFEDVKPCAVGAAVPGGLCNGLVVTVAGTLNYTTNLGTKVTGHPVSAGQVLPIRVKSIDAGTTATVLAGYHS